MANYLSIVADGKEANRVYVAAKTQIMWTNQRYERKDGKFPRALRDQLFELLMTDDGSVPREVRQAVRAANVVEIRDDYRY